MRTLLLLLPLALAACNTQDSLDNGTGQPLPPVANGVSPSEAAPAAAAAVQTATLTGLYEGGAPERRSQMCVVESGGNARFGLVTRASGEQDCSGTGSVVRTGNTLRLTMAGDVACTIEASVEGTRVSFPATLPSGCSYYCSPGGRLTGHSFDKVGGDQSDARRATDLVGDRLCAE